MDKKIIDFIIRAGSVIITTLASFIVFPPAIDSSENVGVNWKNIVTFVAGSLCIILFDKIKKNKKQLQKPIWFIGILIALFICYEALYYTYSTECWQRDHDGTKSYRVVISHGPVKPELALDLEGLKNQPNPINFLLNSYGCSPLNIWNYSELAIPYYSFIILYFLMIIVVILLILTLTDKYESNEYSIEDKNP